MNYNILELLEENLGKGYRKKGGEYLFNCPKHGPSQHHRPKLAININEAKYRCWMCDLSGKPLSVNEPHNFVWSRFFYKIGNYQVAVSLYKESVENSLDPIEKILAKIKGEDEEVVKVEDIIIPHGYENVYVNQNEPHFFRATNYLKKRDVNEDDLIKYNIQYCFNTNKILFPSYDKYFQKNYYIERTLFSNSNFPYNKPKLKNKLFIFNEFLVDFNKTLIIVEGVFDYITTRNNAVPLLGSSINRYAPSPLVENIIINKTEVILALDPDAFDKQIKIAKFLIKNNVDVKMVIWNKDENRDINEMGTTEFNKNLKNNVEEYSYKIDLFNKLEKI